MTYSCACIIVIIIIIIAIVATSKKETLPPPPACIINAIQIGPCKWELEGHMIGTSCGQYEFEFWYKLPPWTLISSSINPWPSAVSVQVGAGTYGLRCRCTNSFAWTVSQITLECKCDCNDCHHCTSPNCCKPAICTSTFHTDGSVLNKLCY